MNVFDPRCPPCLDILVAFLYSPYFLFRKIIIGNVYDYRARVFTCDKHRLLLCHIKIFLLVIAELLCCNHLITTVLRMSDTLKTRGLNVLIVTPKESRQNSPARQR